MRKKISTIDDVKYLVDIEDHSIFEISDYTEISDSHMIIIGIIIERNTSYYWGQTHINYSKKFGCVNFFGEVVIPFVFSKMKQEFGMITAEIVEEGVFFPIYRSFYFDSYGVPVCPNTEIKFLEWEWVEYFAEHNISVGQKNGRQGILRKDGSIFIEPQYLSVNIDYHIPLITAVCEDKTNVQWIYRREVKTWTQLPKKHKYVTDSHGLYIIEKDRLLYAMNTSWKMVVPPYFTSIKVYNSYCIVSKDGVKGLLSRQKFTTIDGLKSPAYAPLLKLEYDDIKEKNGYLIIIKDSKQGIYSIQNEVILLPPCIPIDYSIIPSTLTTEAIAYEKKDGSGKCEYGYFDLFGNLLFKINLDDDKISTINGLKKGKAVVIGNKYIYVFNKDGKYTKEKIKKEVSYFTEHNYEAEKWDALTDGMYGDYPGSGVDYDLLGF